MLDLLARVLMASKVSVLLGQLLDGGPCLCCRAAQCHHLSFSGPAGGCGCSEVLRLRSEIAHTPLQFDEAAAGPRELRLQKK